MFGKDAWPVAGRLGGANRVSVCSRFEKQLIETRMRDSLSRIVMPFLRQPVRAFI
jgi:hypothetical protein